MNFFRKPIFTGFGPNITKKDNFIALSFLFLPWNWPFLNKGFWEKKVEEKFKNYFNISNVCLFDSGRSALQFALEASGIGEGDEVLVQAYTCVVVTNAINWSKAKPVFIDIQNDFNLNFEELKNKKTTKTKAIIIQHTFGKSISELEKIITWAKENNLLVIEDCAHSLGAKLNDQFLGTFGDIGMFSFGSDKIISCVRGGALITNNKNIAIKIKNLKNNLPNPKLIRTIQHLLHYPLFSFSKPLYNIGIGKLILFLAKKFNIINKIIYKEEKFGFPTKFYSSKLANSLAKILFFQIDNLEYFNRHRREIARFYNDNINNKKISKPEWNEDSVWLRYTILMEEPSVLHLKAKKQGIILGNWYNTPIAPKNIDLSKTGYTPNQCPNAEILSSKSINLPTNHFIKIKDARKIVKIINNL
ncbi:MAG TPA: aminotransferase class I/II-fold pyridoxal phosphate-dependent enzyme [Candidatus Magasanikbacteria bacterium]|nr:aminotransferase class I/II-fold pyridoxal phosphate-dependent enzyme [Candidatus Magasanikbacteria bacterium]